MISGLPSTELTLAYSHGNKISKPIEEQLGLWQWYALQKLLIYPLKLEREGQQTIAWESTLLPPGSRPGREVEGTLECMGSERPTESGTAIKQLP